MKFVTQQITFQAALGLMKFVTQQITFQAALGLKTPFLTKKESLRKVTHNEKYFYVYKTSFCYKLINNNF